ncbi:MATE family efflux transporter [Sphingomonas oleivorans]|uniref:MATE family efflux transporter n=2 Tax=Sphingomonas oleivorans TaxID=1735121 RepID=A0A2T5G342_9SPHN|nr:MATE family efflux transporter [Sphingomonas oleivorans]
MLTNVATALFGLADMWVIGRLGDASAQGAVELGAKLLMGLLTVFNFLRSGTVALTAQAAGRADAEDQAATLARAVAVALLIGLILLLARPLVIPAGLDLLDARGQLAADAHLYVGIRYWGGVAWLVNAVLIGWLIGRRRVRAVLLIEIFANIAHVALDLGLVLGLGWGVAGVATATVASETAKLLALATILAGEAPARRALAMARLPGTWQAAELATLFRLNRDLFLRTLLLMAAFLLMTRAGARQGATILAANGILFQLFMLSALILDGFESAAQVLCGEARGGRDPRHFRRLVRALLLWGGATGLVISLAYALTGAPLAASFTTAPDVAAAASAHIGWAVALPLVGMVSFVLDGVFIGATWTRAMLGTMAAALAAFALALLAATPLGNHGLWLAFSLFLLARGAGQALLLPRLIRRTLGTDATADMRVAIGN